MAKASSKATSTSTRTVVGIGFLPDEARHGFLVDVPGGSGLNDMITITEHRGAELNQLGVRAIALPTVNDPSLRVMLDRNRWLALSPSFIEEANRRLRANGLPLYKLTKTAAKSIPVHPSLGKELCVLCWAVEDAPPDDIPNAVRNWLALAPEERWWLYTMTVATTGQAMQKGVGWRKALRAALADNPFVKGEGMSPTARRELLGHSQLALDF